MRKAYAWLIVALIALAGAAPAAAKDEWLRADTHHFIIYSSNDDTKQLDRFATKVERLDSLLRGYFQIPEEDHPNRLTIFIVSKSKEVAELWGDTKAQVAGFYKPAREGSFIVSNRSGGSFHGQSFSEGTLFHEFTHHLMNRYFTFTYPSWYREGFAEYFSTASFDDEGNWELGAPLFGRGYEVLHSDFPIKYVLFGDPNMTDQDTVSAYYGRAWLLVHLTTNDPERSKQREEYLKLIGQGVSAEKAVAKTFGDLGQLDRDLDRYAKTTMAGRKSAAPISFTGSVKITQLDEIDSRLAELQMERRSAVDLQGARDGLEQLAAEAPQRASVLLELGLAERDLAATTDKPDYSLAEAAADSALKLAPDNVRANVLKAEMMEQRLTAAEADERQWAEVRRYISRANHADPEDPLPLLAFSESYYNEGADPPAIAFDALQKAFWLIPEASEVRGEYAFALANKGRFDEALKLVEFLAADPHNGEYGKQLVAQITDMRDGESQASTEDTPKLAGVTGENPKK